MYAGPLDKKICDKAAENLSKSSFSERSKSTSVHRERIVTHNAKKSFYNDQDAKQWAGSSINLGRTDVERIQIKGE